MAAISTSLLPKTRFFRMGSLWSAVSESSVIPGMLEARAGVSPYSSPARSAKDSRVVRAEELDFCSDCTLVRKLSALFRNPVKASWNIASCFRF
ncbi:hypothetical protein D3C85_1737760 [compost metagenome]